MGRAAEQQGIRGQVNLGSASEDIRRRVYQLTALLRKITGQAPNRVYRAEEVLQAIEEPLQPP